MKHFPYKTLSIVVVAVVSTAAAGCRFQIERDPNTLVMSVSGDPPTLNPIVATDIASVGISADIYEQLLKRDYDTFEFKPRLAKRWEVSPDHLSYIFWLREDVRWHDGRPFTADDVVFTLERIKDPKVDSARLRSYYRDVAGVRKVNDHCIEFTYSRPYFKALENVASMVIIPKHIFGDGQDFNTHSAGRHPIGTGPYKFAEWKTGRNVRLVRNDEYWGELPAIGEILYKIIPDPSIDFQMLKKGAIDLSLLLPVQWARQTESGSFVDEFTRHRYYVPNSSMIVWNTRRKLFSDRRIRRAMTMLVNRKEILDKILFGQGEVVTSGFYKFGKDYNDAIEPLPYDPRQACRLLEEAGWMDHDGDGIRDRDGVEFRFRYLYPAGDPFRRSLGLFLSRELASVGISLDLMGLEWAALLKFTSEHNFDAVAMGFVGGFEQDPYQVWHSSEAERGTNISGFSNGRADTIIEQARREFDPERRSQLYRELQEIIHEEQPCTFLFTTPNLVAVAKRFGNVVDHKAGLDMREWTVEPWHVLYEW